MPCLLALGLGGCATAEPRPVEVVEPRLPRVTEDDVAKAIPSTVKDRSGWAHDVMDSLEELRLGKTPQAVCSVLAIIEQESGYKANPTVAGLSDVVQKRLDQYAEKLGPLGRPALKALLDGKAPNTKETFEQRLKHVKTEQDLDIIFRQLLVHYEEKYPRAMLMLDVLGGAFNKGHLEDLNPITTVGSMQVSVRFSAELGKKRGLENEQVRDQLYTRHGGVFYGTARLLGYEAAYPDPLYRFADYNSGMYASRNAALQQQVTELTGFKILADGDLLNYNRVGKPSDVVSNSYKALMNWRARYAPEISDSQMHRDVLLEKSGEFEHTDTWHALKRSYSTATGKTPAYAAMPQVTITSPKMSKDRSTQWYAGNVNKRFASCIKRLLPRSNNS